jgi:hypothetical protein
VSDNKPVDPTTDIETTDADGAEVKQAPDLEKAVPTPVEGTDTDAADPDSAASASDNSDVDDDQPTEVVPRPKPKKAKAKKPKAKPAPQPQIEADDADDEPTVVVPTPRRRPSPTAPAATRTAPATLVATVVATVVAIAVVAAAVVFGVLWHSKSNQLNDLRAAQDRRAEVEKVAGDYAVGAATIDYSNLATWEKAALKGLSPELTTKMQAAQQALQQVFTVVQWRSDAELMDAVVQSDSGDGKVYKVNAYIRVNSHSVQQPNGTSSNVVYAMTLGKNKNGDWEITEVGDNPLSVGGQSAEPQTGGTAAPALPSAAPSTPALPGTDQPAAPATGIPAPAAGNPAPAAGN